MEQSYITNEVETRGLHREGHTLYVEMSLALVANAHGDIVGCVAMARDVTGKALKEREQAQREGSAAGAP
jgi:PAS domain S-box